jgi:hypothetical protein
MDPILGDTRGVVIKHPMLLSNFILITGATLREGYGLSVGQLTLDAGRASVNT